VIERAAAAPVVHQGGAEDVLPDAVEGCPHQKDKTNVALAIQTQGLNAVKRGVLDAVAEDFRLLAEKGYGTRLSYDRLGHHPDVDPVPLRSGQWPK